jgi:hypothetical protein
VQLPLHEPYFDLTPIRVTHTKITLIKIITIYIILVKKATKLIAHTPFGA